jgi:hypothetical protein
VNPTIRTPSPSARRLSSFPSWLTVSRMVVGGATFAAQDDGVRVRGGFPWTTAEAITPPPGRMNQRVSGVFAVSSVTVSPRQ